MSRTVTADQFRTLPRDAATTPRDGEIYVNRWWSCTPDGLLFFHPPGSRGYTPQCNAHQLIAERLSADVHAPLFENVTVELFPIVYLGHWHEDYGHNPFRGLPA